MSLRGSSLQEYCNNLRCIKARNVPTIAARLARTIMLLPTKFNPRKITIEHVAVDRSGQYFDTVWDELIGSNVAGIQGVTLTDARYILDRLEDLSRSVIKFGAYYSGRISAATTEFTSDLNYIKTNGEFYRRISDIRSHVGSTSGLTYNEFGYRVDQATLNNASVERQYDFYEFLKEMSKKDIFTWVYVIQNFITCSKISNSTNYNTLKTYSEKLLDLVTTVVRIVLDIEHKLDDIRPIKLSSVESTVGKLTLEDISPEVFENIYPRWPAPEGAQPDVFSNAFTGAPAGEYRIAIRAEYPLRLKLISVDNEPVATTVIISESDYAVYLTQEINLKATSVVAYSIESADTESGVDPSQFVVYLKRNTDYPVSAIRKIFAPPSIESQGVVEIGDGDDKTEYKKYKISYHPSSTDILLNLYIHINYLVKLDEITSDIGIEVSYIQESSDYINHNYTTNILVEPLQKYISLDNEVSIYVYVPVDENLDMSNIKIEWEDATQLIISQEYDTSGYLKQKYFGDGWIDITKLVNDALPTADSSSTKFELPFELVDFNKMSIPLEGTYQFGMFSVIPPGRYAYTGGNYITFECTCKFDSLLASDKSVTLRPVSSIPAVYDDDSSEEGVTIITTDSAVVGSLKDAYITLVLSKYAAFTVNSIKRAFLSGLHVYIKVTPIVAYKGIEKPAFTAIWPKNPLIGVYYGESNTDARSGNVTSTEGTPIVSDDLTGETGLISGRGALITRSKKSTSWMNAGIFPYEIQLLTNRDVTQSFKSNQDTAPSAIQDSLIIGDTFDTQNQQVAEGTITYPFPSCPFYLNGDNTPTETDFIPNIRTNDRIRYLPITGESTFHYKWDGACVRNAYPFPVRSIDVIVDSSPVYYYGVSRNALIVDIKRRPEQSGIYFIAVDYNNEYDGIEKYGIGSSMVTSRHGNQLDDMRYAHIWYSTDTIFGTSGWISSNGITLRYMRRTTTHGVTSVSETTSDVSTSFNVDIVDSVATIANDVIVNGSTNLRGATFYRMDLGRCADWTVVPDMETSSSQPKFFTYRLFDLRKSPVDEKPITALMFAAPYCSLASAQSNKRRARYTLAALK